MVAVESVARHRLQARAVGLDGDIVVRQHRDQLMAALLRGQAPDRGLYMPDSIPKLDASEINSFLNKTYDLFKTFVKIYFLLNRFDVYVPIFLLSRNLCQIFIEMGHFRR